jgi:hypothetical protein
MTDHVALEPKWDLEDYQWSNYGMIYQITASGPSAAKTILTTIISSATG